MSTTTSGAGGVDALPAAKDGHDADVLPLADPAPSAPLVVAVLGVPAPQGSHKAFVVGKKGGKQRAIVTDDSSKTKPWKQTVKHAAIDALQTRLIREGADTLHAVRGAASVVITFRLPRPKGHYGTGRNEHQVKPGAPLFPAVKPDLDKLVRSTLDALGDAGVWNDDAQVVQLQVRKVYAGRDGLPGAHIEIRQATP